MPAYVKRLACVALMLEAFGRSLFLVVAVLSCCQTLASTALRRDNSAEIQSLDPTKVTDIPSLNVLFDLLEGLVIENQFGEISPALAESWEVNDQQDRYRFHLRSGIQWSNGDPIQAQHFVLAFQHLFNPQTAARNATDFAVIRHAMAVNQGECPPTELGVYAPDDQTVLFELEHPASYFIRLLSLPAAAPVHPAMLQQDNEARPHHHLSTGAYKLEEWIINKHIKLTRNLHYWDNEHTFFDEVYFYPIELKEAALTRYRAGDLDLTASIPSQKIEWLRKNFPSELHISPQMGTYMLSFNLAHPPLKDNPALRRALSLAIDKEILTQKVLSSLYKPAYRFTPPMLDDDPAPKPNPYTCESERVQAAQQAFRDAGYTPEQPLKLTLHYNTSDDHKRIALAIASMWRSVLGVQLQLINEEWRVFLKHRREKVVTEIFRDGRVEMIPDPFFFLRTFQSDDPANDYQYNNPYFDALIQQSHTMSNNHERLTLLAQAEQLLLDDHVFIPLFFYNGNRLIKPYIGGYQPDPRDIIYSKNLYLKER